MKRDTIVAGAGISGLTAARALQRRGVETVVLEACPSVGGLTRTIQVGGYCFDHTGHLLHLERSATPSGLPYAGLRDEDWQSIDPRSRCWFRGRMVSAPLQHHLAELPDAERIAFEESYESRPRIDAQDFRDWLITGFGRRLAEDFLIPLNEKALAFETGRLEATAGKRFFPAEDNSQFWYPRQGGIQALVEGLRHGLEGIRLLEPVVAVNLGRRELRTATGGTYHWDRLFTSMPLKALCAMTEDVQVRAWGAGLSHSLTVSVNLGLRGQPAAALGGVHWIYVPDPAIPFYRVGIYSNVSRAVCPAGASALYLEVAAPGEREPVLREIEQQAIAALEALGWMRREQIACVVTHVIACAYVHYTHARREAVERLRERLEASGVYGIGRYGLWDDASMEDSIYSAEDAVEKALRP